MSFWRSTQQLARKPYRCEWCCQRINVGDLYSREVGTFDGDFQNYALHPECLPALIEDCRDNDGTFISGNERPFVQEGANI